MSIYTHVYTCRYMYISICVCVFHEYNNTVNLRCLLIENQFIIFKTDKNKEKELDIYLNFLI